MMVLTKTASVHAIQEMTRGKIQYTKMQKVGKGVPNEGERGEWRREAEIWADTDSSGIWGKRTLVRIWGKVLQWDEMPPTPYPVLLHVLDTLSKDLCYFSKASWGPVCFFRMAQPAEVNLRARAGCLTEGGKCGLRDSGINKQKRQ